MANYIVFLIHHFYIVYMNILLTSVGRRTYMVDYFKSALKGIGKVYASNSVMTYSMEKADGWFVSPMIYDESYIDGLINFCHTNNISAIISLFDIDLPILAKHHTLFNEKGIRLIVSSERVTQICNDKWETFQFLKKMSLLQPKTYISIEIAINEIHNKYLSFPLILKPRWGMGSIGIYEVEDLEELTIFYKKLKKKIFETYLKYESNADIEHCILIQEKIHGQEFGLDVFNDLTGSLATVVAKRKIAMRAGETDIAEIVENSIFFDIAETISKNLRHIANLDIDVFLLPNNDISVLEMNCRFGGQYPFSHLAGVDFPKQIIKWLLNEDTDKNLITPTIGVISCKDLVPVRMN